MTLSVYVMTSSIMTSFDKCKNMYSLSRNSCAKAFGNWSRHSHLKPKKKRRGRSVRPPHPLHFPLEVSTVKEVKHTKYLGTHISQDFKWNRHIDETTAKANRTLGFLKRNLRMNSPSLKAKAYNILVRPKVVCSSVWDPRPLLENNGAYKIVMVQRCAAQWCLWRYRRTDSVTTMLEKLGWRTLEQHRFDSCLTALYEITRGLLFVETHGLLSPVMCKRRHTHNESFIPLKTSTTSERLSFFSRTVIQWNNLPASIFNEKCNLETFKVKISQIHHLPLN